MCAGISSCKTRMVLGAGGCVALWCAHRLLSTSSFGRDDSQFLGRIDLYMFSGGDVMISKVGGGSGDSQARCKAMWHLHRFPWIRLVDSESRPPKQLYCRSSTSYSNICRLVRRRVFDDSQHCLQRRSSSCCYSLLANDSLRF